MTKKDRVQHPRKESKERSIFRSLQTFYIVLVLGLAAGAYRILIWGKLNDSAALYIGLPLLIALALALLPKSGSTAINSIKVTLIGVLLSAPVFGEGFLCILFSLPIFLSVAVAIGAIIDVQRIRKNRGGMLKVSCIVFFAAILALEGTTPELSFNRQHEVSVTRILPLSIEETRATLAGSPALTTPYPVFLRIFPQPVSATGHGLEKGDRRLLHFSYNKHLFFTPREGDIEAVINYAEPNHYRFQLVRDTTYISHYLAFQDMDLLLEPLGEAQTRMTLHIRFTRHLDPVWYFAPLQKYAVWLAGSVLIDNVNPHQG